MSIIDTIESSAVIQQAKAAYAAAQASGDAAGMAAAHDRANAYRQAQGGYVDIYEAGQGTNFARIVTGVAAGDQSAGSKIIQQISDTASGVIDQLTGAVTQPPTGGTKLVILDSAGSYNPGDYTQTYSSVSGAGSLDTYLGYGVVGLILIAVLSRVMNK